MTKKKILVLTDDMPWGHRSIAKAIYGYLKAREKKEELEVDLAEVKAEMGPGADLYTFVYRYIPSTNRLAHKLAEIKGLREMFEELSWTNVETLKKLVVKENPDLIICSYYYHSHALARYRDQIGGHYQLWSVAADPWTVNPATLVTGAEKTVVYDEVTRRESIKYGIEPGKILMTGWWTREEMYDDRLQNKNYQALIRKKMGLANDRPVVFVGGGSLGTNSLTKLLPVLMVVKRPVELVINTGTDKLAFSMVEEYVRMVSKVRKDEVVKVRNMGWIENMAEVLGACDIVFGKAGPNFLFDVVAVGKPLVAITHIGGQEDGNIDLIRKKGLGWVKEKGSEAAEFLLEYLEKPEKYNHKFTKSILKEREKNRLSLAKILGAIKEMPTKS